MDITRLLMVRAGEDAVLADALERDGFVAIGWFAGRDASGISTREDLDSFYRQTYGEDHEKRRPTDLAQLWPFFSAVPGDSVITYNRERSYYLLGTITGPVEHRPDLGYETSTGSSEQVRPVQWTHRIARDALSSRLRKRLDFPQTIFVVEKPEQVEELLSHAVPLATNESVAGDHHYWFLLSRPDIWDLREAVKTASIGDTETWGVPKGKIREAIKIGDSVVLYQAGADPAVRALGEIASLPREVPLRDRKKPRADGEQRDHEWIVDVRYTRFLENPIPRNALVADPVLAGLNGLRARGGTIFWMDAKQWNRLIEMIDGGATHAKRELAVPFNRIFSSWDEAWWAFDFARDALAQAGVSTAEDPLLSVTLPRGENKFHVDYGQWLFMGFYSPSKKGYRVAVPLLRDRGAFADAVVTGPFVGQPNRPATDLCGLSLEQAQNANESERREMTRAFDEARIRFSSWARSPYRPAHNSSVAEALFDDEVRQRVLAEGPFDAQAWSTYVYWAAKILEDQEFLESSELEYKRRIGRTVGEVREHFNTGGGGWAPELAQALRSGRDQNIVDYRAADPARSWATESAETLAAALAPLWSTPSPGADEFVAFFDAVPAEYKQARSNALLSLLLMGRDPTVYPPYRATSFGVSYKLTGFALRSPSDYAKALRFLDRLITEAGTRGVTISDRLVAQSLVFCIEQINPSWHPSSFSADDARALIDYREGNTMPDFYRFVRHQHDFNFPDWLITDYVLALATKPFVILSGISGTGKTRIAQFLSEYLAPDVTVDAPRAEEPEVEDGQFLHRIGVSTLKYRGLTIPVSALPLLPTVPERGTGTQVSITVDGAGTFKGRINHVGYTGRQGTVVFLRWHTDLNAWLNEAAALGDYLVCEPNDDESAPAVSLRLVPAQHETVTESSLRRAFMSVRADWTDNRQLLGYFNPLLGQYVPTELLKLLLRAKDDPTNPYFVILDEMNLAKVEYYFSDFLSAMEGNEKMILHDVGSDLVFEDDDAATYLIPERLAVPPNVFFSGTVNVDETTYMFSPKVLDRANVIEFNEVHLPIHGAPAAEDTDAWRLEKADVEGLASALMHYVPAPEDASTARNPMPEDWNELRPELQRVIVALNDTLRPDHLHFGYRVANEMARFINAADRFTNVEDPRATLDLQVLQKVLPKLNGSRARLETPLTRLMGFAQENQLPKSREKLERMLKTLKDVGFVSFVE